MEEITNLSDFLTEIADAIREKKESTELIEAQDFANEIRQMETLNTLQCLIDNRVQNNKTTDSLFAGWTDSNLYKVVSAVDLSLCVSLYALFENCRNVEELPLIDTTNNMTFASMFYGCVKLKTIDVTYINPDAWTRVHSMIQNCHSLTKLIIRRMPTIVPYYIIFNYYDTDTTIAQSTGLYHFAGTSDSIYNPEGLKDGYVYVPDDKVEELRVAAGWSTIADRIRGLSALDESLM